MLDHMSVYDWIERVRARRGHHSPMGRLLDAAYAEEYGADTTGQASLNLLYLLAFQPNTTSFEVFGVSDEKFHIAGGNQQLPEAIADRSSTTSSSAGRCRRSGRNRDGTVSLTFSTGGRTRTVVADHAILAIPFAVLRNLDYSGAGFDTRKQTAITQLGTGRNTKLQLQFASRYWNTRGPWGKSTGGILHRHRHPEHVGRDARAGRRHRDHGRLLRRLDRRRLHAVDAVLERRLESAGDGVREGVPQAARARLPGDHARSGPARRRSRRRSATRCSTCSYSYWKVGQYTSFSGYEGVPQGNIHFAGEHCSQDFQGFMEGGASGGHSRGEGGPRRARSPVPSCRDRSR